VFCQNIWVFLLPEHHPVGIQPEVDLCPRISNGVYGYFDYGYSESSLFPVHRAGGEIYKKLPKGLEASAGLRYLNFSATSTVFIYTGSIGWYYKDYWISFRPFVTQGTPLSYTLSLRRYFKDADNYPGVTGGVGFSPDDHRMQSSNGLSTNNIYILQTQKFGVIWKKNLKKTLLPVCQCRARSPGAFL